MMYARTRVEHMNPALNRKEWTKVIKTFYQRFPSGMREMVVFIDGYVVKADSCDICYVAE